MLLCVLVAALLGSAVQAEEDFLCAPLGREDRGAAKVAQNRSTTGNRRALVIFAQFAGERPGWEQLPEWSADLFKADLPGSFSHFYRAMSFDQLLVDGEVAPRVYTSSQPVDAYLAEGAGESGRYGSFSLDILEQVDREIDFTRFDSDGPDGVPNSADDDGYVDALFLVLASTPENFLQGEATGIAHLGFSNDFSTDERTARGLRIRILSHMGTIQRGRTFAEAIGSMCHEYGHVLGLPDLYDIAFIDQGGPPEWDSAGIGAWGLMGWGATGWNGNDGPNSFCAFSRMRLGWARVEGVVQREVEIRLEDVGESGRICQVPLSLWESFLLENRRRSSYYDRNIPAEGMLIWHVAERGPSNRVDLECADGRWREAGYPLGEVAAGREGGDNLDFWAHDREYARAHGGNLGDETDPFDGLRFRAFTEETNPSAHGNERDHYIRVEDIRFEEGDAFAKISATPVLRLAKIRVEDVSGDGVLAVGENVHLAFELSHDGPLLQRDLWVELVSTDSLIEVVGVREELENYVEKGDSTTYFVGEGDGLAVRFVDEFSGVHTGSIWIDIQVRWGQEWLSLWREELTLEGFSPRQIVARIAVIDSLGNGDGQLQAGEFVRLELTLETERWDLLAGFEFRLRSLDGRVRPLEGSNLLFEGGASRSSHSPEFLVSADVEEGEELAFELEIDSGFGSWRDTLAVEVGLGGDATPPRVIFVHALPVEEGVLFSLPAGLVMDGSPIRSAAVRVYSAVDSTELARVRLELDGREYGGLWEGGEAGGYLIEGMVEDVEGNWGKGMLQTVVVGRPDGASTGTGDPLVRAGGEGVTAVEYAPDRHWVAVAEGRRIRLLRAYNLEEETVLEHEAVLTAIAFGPDGILLAAGDRGGVVRLWNVPLGRELGVLGNRTGRVESVAFSPDGQLLAVGGWDGAVDLWEVVRPRKVGRLVQRYGTVGSLAVKFSPDGRTLVVGDSEGKISLWEVDAQRLMRHLTGHEDWVESVAFSPDGQLLASGSRDGTVRLWHLDQPKRLPEVLKGGDGWINSVSFHPDGRLLVAGGWDGMVRCWRMADLKEVAVLEGHEGWVKSVAFSPDGLQLASGGADRTVRFWRVPEVGSAEALPVDVALVEFFPPFPNPFNSGVWIPFGLTRSGKVVVYVYDISGQVVRRFDLGRRAAGRYLGQQAVFWDGTDGGGMRVASGVYLYAVEFGSGLKTPEGQKVLFLK